MKDIVMLSNGVEMPHLSLGTYPMMGQELFHSVSTACKLGYRMVDTADNYYNEKDLGDCLSILYKNASIKREDIFLISKVSDELYHPNLPGGGLNKGIFFWKNSEFMREANAVHKIVNMKLENSLKFLQTDYLDLYMMHWPYPDFMNEIWYEMEELYISGKVRAIGVCNFRERHLKKLKQTCRFLPMVNQFETSPLNTKETLVDYCKENNIKVMVYSPLMSLRKNISKYRDYLKTLATKYNKDCAQIILRFDIQRGLIPIPKSSNPIRLRNNISLFDFELTNEEMMRLSSFNCDLQTLPESRSCPGL